MSDYIGNLVAKNLNPRAVLQPRLASRFEPLMPLASLASERQFDDTSFDKVVPQDEATQAMRGPTEPEIMPRPASMIAQNSLPPMRDARRRLAKRPEPDNLPEEQHAPPARSTPYIPALSSDTLIAPRRLNPAHHLSEMRDQMAKVDERGDIAQRIPARPEPHEKLAQDRRKAIQPVPPLVEQVVSHERQAAITPSMPLPTSHDDTLALNPLRELPPTTIVQPVITGSRLAPPAEPPQPATTTIHVTIGRIEVRATPSPSASKQRPAPAVMSLDDYLKRREGERS